MVDLNHGTARAKMLAAAIRLLRSLEGLTTVGNDARREGLHRTAAAALGEVLEALEVECHAVHKAAAKLKRATDASEAQLRACDAMAGAVREVRSAMVEIPGTLAGCLAQLHLAGGGSAGSAGSSGASSADKAPQGAEAHLLGKARPRLPALPWHLLLRF